MALQRKLRGVSIVTALVVGATALVGCTSRTTTAGGEPSYGVTMVRSGDPLGPQPTYTPPPTSATPTTTRPTAPTTTRTTRTPPTHVTITEKMPRAGSTSKDVSDNSGGWSMKGRQWTDPSRGCGYFALSYIDTTGTASGDEQFESFQVLRQALGPSIPVNQSDLKPSQLTTSNGPIQAAEYGGKYENGNNWAQVAVRTSRSGQSVVLAMLCRPLNQFVDADWGVFRNETVISGMTVEAAFQK